MADEPLLRIPDGYQGALRLIAELTKEDQRRLVDGLDVREGTIRPADLAGRVVETMPALSVDDSRKLIELLVSLHAVKRALKLPSDVIASAVSRTEALSLPEVDGQVLAERLQALLEAPSIDLVSRATDLLSEHQHALREGRILSDIRPLFRQGDETALDGAVVVHTLRLRYADLTPHSIYLTTDRTGLEALRSLIERALRKGDRLEALVRDAGLPNIEPGNVPDNEDRV